MSRPIAQNSRGGVVNTFAGTALGVLIVAVLYFAQTIFIPVALAVFLTFLMAPVVDRVERWTGRAVAVVASVLGASGLLICVGWMATHQLTGLAQTLKEPQYRQNIGAKTEKVQQWIQGVKQMTLAVEENVGGTGKDADKKSD